MEIQSIMSACDNDIATRSDLENSRRGKREAMRTETKGVEGMERYMDGTCPGTCGALSILTCKRGRAQALKWHRGQTP